MIKIFKKKYMLFKMNDYYPTGGMLDFEALAETLEEIYNIIKKYKNEVSIHFQIFNTEDCTIYDEFISEPNHFQPLALMK